MLIGYVHDATGCSAAGFRGDAGDLRHPKEQVHRASISLHNRQPEEYPVDMDRTVSAFDTLAASRNLESAGMDRAQAEAVATELATAARAERENLATKADLAALENRILKIAFGVVAAQTALTVGLLKIIG